MIYLDEKLSNENESLIYKIDNKDPALQVIKFENRIVDNDKVCYVAIFFQDNKYYLFGAKYLEEFLGFEIKKSDLDIIQDYFKTYEIEKLVNFRRYDYIK